MEIQGFKDLAYVLSWKLSLNKIRVVVNIHVDAKGVVQGLD